MTTPVSEEHIEKRFTQKSRAIAQRIRDVMGSLTQGELAERVEKGASTVSNHLSGRANLTLRTIIEYAVALDEEIISVPDVKRPRKQRRHSSEGRCRVSKQREALDEIDPVKRQLNRFLTTLAARIGQVLQENEDLSQQVLAERLGKDPSYVSRVLGGGVNLTLRTVVQFEEALGACILSVKDTPKGTFTGRHKATAFVQLVQKTDDGCHFEDRAGNVTKGMTGYLESKREDIALFSRVQSSTDSTAESR